MTEKTDTLNRIFQVFPLLKDSEKIIQQELLEHTINMRMPKGEIVFIEGDECKHIALLLSGRVRVYKAAENGREITLYRLGPGESCVLTASCIFSQNSFPAVALIEEDIEAVMIPSIIFREWVNKYEIWRTYIFNLLANRLTAVITTLEEVAFRKMDVRIAEFLLRKSGTDNHDITITHQDIAMELGTSREVISRILKNFESEKLISLKRGTITINNSELLTYRSDRS